ncbi:MAG: NAD(P)/FAD-dependent oxidoreductase, partial [Actinomycetota bacterium]|nr:NAD(P)/FAD-dependent oxidoreductase [Actinomycetota bacterium]
CGVVPHPNTDVDYMRTQRQASMNSARWAQDADLTEWLQNARLDGFSRGQPSAGTEIPAEMAAHLKSVMENTLPSIEKLGRFLASLEPPS